MDYKDFIKPGEKVIFVPEEYEDYKFWLCQTGPEVVTIGSYRPYYTDGSPDPKPEDYMPWCCVEIESETKCGETQPRLYSLLPIVKEEKTVVYDGKDYETYGYSGEIEDENIEEKRFVVLKTDDGFMVVPFEDVEEVHTIDELTYEQLVQLRGQICVGSVYLADYKNTFGVTMDEVCSVADSYDVYLGEDADVKDTPEEFASYVCDMYGIPY